MNRGRAGRVVINFRGFRRPEHTKFVSYPNSPIFLYQTTSPDPHLFSTLDPTDPMAGPSRDQGQSGSGAPPTDRASPQIFPAHVPEHILEFLAASTDRPRAVPPVDAPQGPNDAKHPFDIVNEARLTQWATTEPAQLLGHQHLTH